MMKRTTSLLMVFVTLGSLSGCTSRVQDPPVDPGKTKAEAPKSEAPKVDAGIIKAEAPKVNPDIIKAEAPKVDANIFKVEWVKVEIPAEMEKGKEYALPVTVKNASDGVWPSQGEDEKNSKQVAISYHWLPAEGEKPVIFDALRTLLAKDLAPGESFSTQVAVLAPTDPGTYRLQLTLVQEQVNWFEERGAQTEIKSLVVR